MRLAIAAALLFAVTWGAPPALAAPCGHFEEIETGLASSHGEKPAAMGNTEKTMTVVFVNPETGTFTVVAVGSDGTGCLISAAEHWRLAKVGKPS